MGKTVSNPKKHVVSFRVSEDELMELLILALQSDLSLTELARQRVLEAGR